MAKFEFKCSEETLSKANEHLNKMIELAGLEVTSDLTSIFVLRKRENIPANTGISVKTALAKIIYLYGD